MKISCEVIKDLLPLYHDGVCSDDSKALIEAHLAACASCQAEFQAMNSLLPIHQTEQNLQEADIVKRLSRRWKRGMLKSLLKGILIAAIVVFILYIFVDFRIFV